MKQLKDKLNEANHKNLNNERNLSLHQPFKEINNSTIKQYKKRKTKKQQPTPIDDKISTDS